MPCRYFFCDVLFVSGSIYQKTEHVVKFLSAYFADDFFAVLLAQLGLAWLSAALLVSMTLIWRVGRNRPAQHLQFQRMAITLVIFCGWLATIFAVYTMSKWTFLLFLPLTLGFAVLLYVVIMRNISAVLDDVMHSRT